eukprot:c26566_g1_i4 orf=658-1167(-)
MSQRNGFPAGDGVLSTHKSGMRMVVLACGTLVYYHCAFRDRSLVTLVSDCLIVLMCSLAVLGMLFRHCNVSVPIDPLEWEVSQDSANHIAACIANVVGAAESVLRVAANGEDRKLFLKLVITLYLLSAVGRAVSGAVVAYTETASQSPFLFRKRDGARTGVNDGWKLES